MHEAALACSCTFKTVSWVDRSSTHYHPFSQELRSRTEALPERPPGLWIRRTPTCVMALAVVIAHEELIIVALVS